MEIQKTTRCRSAGDQALALVDMLFVPWRLTSSEDMHALLDTYRPDYRKPRSCPELIGFNGYRGDWNAVQYWNDQEPSPVSLLDFITTSASLLSDEM
jgi:hypothetical protein